MLGLLVIYNDHMFFFAMWCYAYIISHLSDDNIVPSYVWLACVVSGSADDCVFSLAFCGNVCTVSHSANDDVATLLAYVVSVLMIIMITINPFC